MRRSALAARFPVHVTARLKEGLPSLRRGKEYGALVRAFEAAAKREGFRLVHYSVQSNHLHLLAEAKNRDVLARGLQGLFVRIARGLNRLWERKGSVFADRYHDRVLRTPREVRNALSYVLNNCRRHGVHPGHPDPFSSGFWFDGWKRDRRPEHTTDSESFLSKARTWLLTVGWRRHRLIRYLEVPGG